MTISFVVLTLLGLYLDNVLPSGLAQKEKWYFLCTKRWWCPNRARGTGRRIKIEQGVDDDDFERSQMKPDKYELIGDNQRKLESQKKLLKV